jgi:ribosome modulation factor
VSYKLSRGKRAVLLGRLAAVVDSVKRREREEDMVARDRLNEAFGMAAGAQARRIGQTAQSCPYGIGSALRAPWLVGWREQNLRLKLGVGMSTA